MILRLDQQAWSDCDCSTVPLPGGTDCDREIHPSVGKWSRWGLWTTINAFAIGYHPVHNSWVQLNCRDPRERSVSIAMWVMSAISCLMVGTQYYRANDVPFYRKGLRIQFAMVAIGMLLPSSRKPSMFCTTEGPEGGGKRRAAKNWLYTP